MKPRIELVASAPCDIIKGYTALMAKNSALPLDEATARSKYDLALEASAIYEADIAGNPAFFAMPMREALKAADYQDPQGQLGLLSGTLALQRSLELFRYEFPVLGTIASDFSGEPGLLHQTANSRITITPPVQTYDPSLDATGRPKGWSTISPARSIDVSVTLDEYLGVPIVFGAQTLASTMRKLFDETAPMAMYALASRIVAKLTALFTPQNFNAYAATSATGGEATSGQTTIVVASTAGMYPGLEISGTGIPAYTFIQSITDGTHAVLNQAATATNTGLTFTLGTGKVPTTYTTYVKALADFSMASLDEIAAALDENEVPQGGRFALLNSQYYRRLRADPALNMFFAAVQQPEIITKGTLPELTGFNPIKAPYFPKTNNRVGFAGHRASAIIKTRLPGGLVGTGVPLPGSVTTVVDSKTEMAVALVQYANLQSNYSEFRPEVLLGAAVGDRRGGLVMTSEE